MSTWFRTYGFADVCDDLLVGAYPLDAEDVGMLEWVGVQRILNLVEDREYDFGRRGVVESALANAGIGERRLALTDYGGIPPDELESAVQVVQTWLEEGLRTYVHCRAGWQRSAVVAAGVIALREGIEIDDALSVVQRRKPSADPLPHQREDLRRWWESRKRLAAEGAAGASSAVEGDDTSASAAPRRRAMTSAGPVRRRVVVHGRVQGVFFRDSTRERAEAHGVAGWVANRSDGGVEAVLEGDPEAVARVVWFLEMGPLQARVESVEVHEEVPDGLTRFEVR